MDSRHHCQQQLKLCDSKTATRFSAGALSKTMCRCSSTVRSQILFRTQAMVLHAPIDKYFTLFYLLAVPHSQTHGLVPVSMADRSLVSTTDCILLNQSNYRKENKPEIVKLPPLRPAPECQPYFWLQQVSLTCKFKGATNGNTKAPLNRAAKVVHLSFPPLSDIDNRAGSHQALKCLKEIINLADICAQIHASFDLVKWFFEVIKSIHFTL